jgi:hypothetical protein
MPAPGRGLHLAQTCNGIFKVSPSRKNAAFRHSRGDEHNGADSCFRGFCRFAEAFLKDQITIGHALLIAKLPTSQQQEAFSASFRGLWTSEGNSQVLIPVRELALCGAPHKVNNAACVFMQSAAA